MYGMELGSVTLKINNHSLQLFPWRGAGGGGVLAGTRRPSAAGDGVPPSLQIPPHTHILLARSPAPYSPFRRRAHSPTAFSGPMARPRHGLRGLLLRLSLWGLVEMAFNVTSKGACACVGKRKGHVREGEAEIVAACACASSKRACLCRCVCACVRARARECAHVLKTLLHPP